MPPPPGMHKPNATIIFLKIVFISKTYSKFEKKIPLVWRACRNKSIDV